MKPAGKIQYLGAKAIEFLLISDLDKAKEVIRQAIGIANENSSNFNETYDYSQVGNIFVLGGRLLKDKLMDKNLLNISGKLVNVY